MIYVLFLLVIGATVMCQWLNERKLKELEEKINELSSDRDSLCEEMLVLNSRVEDLSYEQKA